MTLSTKSKLTAGLDTAVPSRLAPAAPAAVPGMDGWIKGGVAVLDEEGCIVRLNPVLEAWLGSASTHPAGRPLCEALAGRWPEARDAVSRFLSSPAEFDRTEIQAVSGGARRWYSLELARHNGTCYVRFESILPPFGEFAEEGLLHGKPAEGDPEVFIRLLQAETRLDNLLHQWPGVIFSQRPDFSFSFVSPKVEELTGAPPSHWQSQTGCFWRVVHEADAERLQQRLQTMGGVPSGLSSTYRMRHALTGRVIYIWEHRQPVRSPNGLLLGYEGIWLDLTRQTVAEKRLSTMAWKESVGVLTMGLAHDLCNVLAGIMGLSETFQTQNQDRAFQEGLALIQRNATQATELIQRIRQLYQGAVGEKSYQDLNVVVSEMVELLRKVVRRHIHFETQFDPQQLPVYADGAELRQLVVNLTLNAVDAMPAGGRLSFRTSRPEGYATAAHAVGRPPRFPAVCLSVQDTGLGICPRYLPNIFDPFFTTKPMNKGSGLGLYNARLFVEKHAGAITVETREQAGTTFHVWLPEADFTEAQRKATELSSRRHTLLAVGHDDQALTRAVGCLREHGYYVVAAPSKEAAVEALHNPDYQFTGVLVLAGPQDAALFDLFDRVQAERLPIKTILHVLGCNPDEIDTRSLHRADLIVPPDPVLPEFLKQLQSVLDSAMPLGL